MVRSWYKLAAVLAIGVLLVLPIGFLVLAGAGQVTGVEFSPDSFSRRSFRYKHLPYLNLTLSGIEYDDIANSLEKSLIADGWISPVGMAPLTWDLVSDSGGSVDSSDYDARLLCGYLEMQDAWTAFNNEAPQKAKVFWPAVAHMARNGMYIYLADVMQLGLSHNSLDGEAFPRRLYDMVASAYLKRAELEMARNAWQSAADRADCAIEFGDLSGSREAQELIEAARKLKAQAELAKALSENAPSRNPDTPGKSASDTRGK